LKEREAPAIDASGSTGGKRLRQKLEGEGKMGKQLNRGGRTGKEDKDSRRNWSVGRHRRLPVKKEPSLERKSLQGEGGC